ncbi:MAG: hypothetical protein JRJ03_07230 [Deltaproteobacteria bacterium]|nr:hypothetical protein [Deltaproteobacteria bacterium]
MKSKFLRTCCVSSIVLLWLMILSSVPTQAQKSAIEGPGFILTGRVISAYGPVEKARVRVAGQDDYVLTDKKGRFFVRLESRLRGRVRVTAGKEGWFNNGKFSDSSGYVGDIFLNPVFLNDQPGYRFISPRTCAQCHVKLSRYWNKSKMAHTTSNPKVLDMYYGTDAYKRPGVAPGFKLDYPESNGNCTTCHAPSAAASGPWSVDLGAVLSSPRTEWDGVSCDYCHKVRKVIPDDNSPSRMSAVLERQASRRGPSILVFGPYDDVVVPPMAASYSAVFEKGEFCSLCHSHMKDLGRKTGWNPETVYTPSERQAFGLKDSSTLPIQTTYQEWKLWQDQLTEGDPNKGKKCQDCHMSWRKDMLPYDNYVVDGMARHMWATFRSPKNIHPHHFEGATETQLRTSLSMELEGEVKGENLVVNVYITNTNGGHWVPTGEPMRSVMLIIDAHDSEDRPLKMIKGTRLPDWAGQGRPEKGNYAGLPGTVFARVLQDKDGNLHVPFWKAAGIASDTRIRPKETLNLRFEFALTDPEDEPSVEARLVYRPVVRPIAEKKRWITEDITIASSVW